MNLDHNTAVEKYIALTAQIAELGEQRKALLPNLTEGRNFGEHKDVRVAVSSSRTLDMFKLRKYVTQSTIDMCSVIRKRNSVSVVSKLKPKKVMKS